MKHTSLLPTLASLVFFTAPMLLAAQESKPRGSSSAPGDALTALIYQQIESFSDVSSRGDSTALNNRLDEDILFSAGDGTVQRDEKRDKSDDLSALLKRQTQAFRDATQRDDLPAMRAYLDDGLLFINEDGVVTDSRSFLTGSPVPHPPDIPSTLTLTDWVLHSSGDVAVSNFINDRITHYGTQVLNDKFLSIDTWIKRGETWKLLASQTIPLFQDPFSGTPPAGALNEYLGDYTIAPGCTVTVSRDGAAIAYSINGSKPVPLLAEFYDVFFVPGESPGTSTAPAISPSPPSSTIASPTTAANLSTPVTAPPKPGSSAAPAGSCSPSKAANFCSILPPLPSSLYPRSDWTTM